MTEVMAEFRANLIGIGTGQDILRGINEAALNLPDRFVRASTTDRCLRDVDRRKHAIPPDRRKDAEECGSIHMSWVCVIGFSLMPQHMGWFQPRVMQPLDGDHDTPVERSTDCPVLD